MKRRRRKQTVKPPLQLPPPSTPREVRIVRIPMNKKMVEVEAEGSPGFHLVEVGRNETFAVGDILRVVPHETQLGVWQNLTPIPRARRRS